jgi:hypothetical protein
VAEDYAQAQILYGSDKKKSIGGIEIDAFIEETYNHTAQVTEYPVEQGFKINDHVVHSPDSISVNGVIGEASIYEDYSQELPPANRAQDYYFKLVDLKEKGEPITIVTGLKVYENMLITSLSVTRNAQNGKSLVFTMDLTKVTIIKSQLVALTNLGGTTNTKRQTQSKVEIGKTQGDPVPEEKRNNFLDEIRKQRALER